MPKHSPNEAETTWHARWTSKTSIPPGMKWWELAQIIYKTKETVLTTVETLDTHFMYAYSATCHRSQGASVDKSIAIFEWDKTKLITHEWFYTAITRATDINKVRFYRSLGGVDVLNEEVIRRYLQRKVNQYKLQDLKAGRTSDEAKYITAEWLMDRVNSRCNSCGCNFEFNVYNGVIHSNFDANRLNIDISHYIESCHRSAIWY